MIRVLSALQIVDSEHVVTPEGWRPGDAVLLPPHQDQASLLAEADDPMWFHRSKPQSQKG
jgi:peroxiredoxin (alkyl hydroperoxide reductase subunit C)